MKMSRPKAAGAVLCFLCSLVLAGALHALTVDEILKLKQAGVEDRTIQMLIEREKAGREGTGGVGVEVTTRPDGSKEVNYYSVPASEEERKAQQEEEKMEKAMEILRNIIIDDRRLDDRRR